MIWKTTFKYFQFVSSIFLLVRLKASCIPKISFLGALEVRLFGWALILVVVTEGKQSQPSLALALDLDWIGLEFDNIPAQCLKSTL